MFRGGCKSSALLLLAATLVDLGFLMSGPQIVSVSAKSRKMRSGITNTIRRACVNPPTQDDMEERVEFGDKVVLKMSAYAEKEGGQQEYSPEVAEKEVLVGRANVPALNEHLDGMCPGEIRRVMTWVNVKQQAGPIAYMVELKEILGKRLLQKGPKGEVIETAALAQAQGADAPDDLDIDDLL